MTEEKKNVQNSDFEYIMELTEEEKRELLALWKERRANRAANE